VAFDRGLKRLQCVLSFEQWESLREEH